MDISNGILSDDSYAGWKDRSRGFIRGEDGARAELSLPKHIADGETEFQVTLGRGAVLRILPGGFVGSLHATIGDGGLLEIGPDTTLRFAQFHVAAGTAATLGADCMLGWGVRVMTTDFHPLFDVNTGERRNPDQSVSIGSHVWLADEVVVLKGAKIADGTAVGIRGVCSGDLNGGVYVGVPARLVAEGTRWER